MLAPRHLTLVLALLTLPGLAEAAPRANAPAAATPSRAPADRSVRPAEPAATPVPSASKATPRPATDPARPVSKASSPRDRRDPAARAATPRDPAHAARRDPATTIHPSRRDTAHAARRDPATTTHPSRRDPAATRRDPATTATAPRPTREPIAGTTTRPAREPAPPATRARADAAKTTPQRTARSSTPAGDPTARTPRTSGEPSPAPTRGAQPAPKASREQASSAAQPAPKASREDIPSAAQPLAPTRSAQPAPKASREAASSAQPPAPTRDVPPDPKASREDAPATSPATTAQPPAHTRAAQPAPRTSREETTAQPTAPTRGAQPAPRASLEDPPVPATIPIPATLADTSSPGHQGPPVPAASPAQPVPTASPTTRPPVPVASPAPTTRPARSARSPRLRPRHEPLLAAHPAASCALDPLEAVGLSQHERTRASLREFYWSDMARFFETTFDESEPGPRQADDPAFTPAADVIATLPASARGPLTALAGARVVDRLSGAPWTKTHKLLSALSPAQVAALLRADAPTLRAHVWTWLATTKTGGCHLGHIDLDFLDAAVADRSIAVEHGDDLVYRSLGDYALEARARLATLDPARFDAFLLRLTAAGEVDPLVRATAHGILLRRAHWDTLDHGLRDPSPPVRAATAAAAAEMNRDRLEARLVEHAAGDPVDLVTEGIVGSLLGVHDPHNHGRPQLRGLLATTRDERLLAAVARWRGRGDALAPLPNPARPLKFGTPVPTSTTTGPDPEPTPTPSTPAYRPSGASPAAAAAIHAAEQERQQTTTSVPRPERSVPSVLDRNDDDDDDALIPIPPVRP